MQSAAEPLAALPTVDDLRSLAPDAWEALYVQTRPALYRFARSRLATGEQAEDAVSETMVRAMSAMVRYRPGPSGLSGWLFGIARNVINEMYRSGQRLQVGIGPADVTAPESVDRVIADEDRAALRSAFATLPSDDQELLGLRIVARFDTETTARVLGKRPGAIRMAQARALGRLRVTLQGGDR